MIVGLNLAIQCFQLMRYMYFLNEIHMRTVYSAYISLRQREHTTFTPQIKGNPVHIYTYVTGSVKTRHNHAFFILLFSKYLLST